MDLHKEKKKQNPSNGHKILSEEAGKQYLLTDL